jgi:hypothetical protein
MKTLDIIHFTVTQDPIPICTLNPNVPAVIEKVIKIMVAKNKEDRVQVLFS